MELQHLQPGAGVAWLIRGFQIAWRHLKVLMAAAGLLFGCIVVLGIVAGMVGIALGAAAGGPMTIMVIFGFIGMIMYPVLMGGFLRLIDSREHGREAGASTLFDALSGDGGAGRLAAFGIGLTVLSVLMLAVIYFTIGHDLLVWYWHTLAIEGAASKAAPVSPMPAGSAITIIVLVVFAFLYNVVFVLGVGQIALLNRAPWHAFTDAASGISNNVLPLLVVGLCGAAVGLLFTALMGILLAVVVQIGGLVSPSLAGLLMVVGYTFTMLLMSVISKSVIYAIWDGISGNSALDDTTASATTTFTA